MSSWYNNFLGPQKEGVLQLEGMPQLGGIRYKVMWDVKFARYGWFLASFQNSMAVSFEVQPNIS